MSQSRISTLEADSGALTLNQLLALFGAYGLQLQVENRGDATVQITQESTPEW
ncbi:hypothetical protein PAMC26577_03545 [Caballeronia sordidicola]|uniref:Uncharacterized protein n=1 Tax=Caballeronia sordidicola TaxID=196367 RepID=A0A242N5H6_CABSO|nr:hypothetical protein PAMC26577_03545 [Caballeronia sordidicola]